MKKGLNHYLFLLLIIFFFFPDGAMADSKNFYDCISFLLYTLLVTMPKSAIEREKVENFCFVSLFLLILFNSLMKCFGKLKFNCNAFYVCAECKVDKGRREKRKRERETIRHAFNEYSYHSKVLVAFTLKTSIFLRIDSSYFAELIFWEDN